VGRKPNLPAFSLLLCLLILRGKDVSSELSGWERYIFNERQLRERFWELPVAIGVFGLIGTGCAIGLALGWSGLALAESAREWLWVGRVTGVAGTFSAWRQWRYVALLRKVLRRISELEARDVSTELADDRSPAGGE
jgi:hypothetical protein